MKTTFEFRSGFIQVVENVAPSFMMDAEEGPTVCGVDDRSNNVTEDVPLELLTRVVWEADR